MASQARIREEVVQKNDEQAALSKGELWGSARKTLPKVVKERGSPI